jgi:hypothetical protein
MKMINSIHKVGNGPRGCIGPRHQHAFTKTEQNTLIGLLDHA